jgi:DnaJ-domain-containing protein 1
MTIGKRLVNLARANLTDFRQAFDRDRLRDLLTSKNDEAQEVVEEESEESIGAKAGRGARRVKDAAEEAWERAYDNARKRAGVRGEPPRDPAADRKRWYRTLELQPGADLKMVRRSYRKLMLQYHPDRHAKDPEKYKAATEVTRKLTEAYNGLTRYLGG